MVLCCEIVKASIDLSWFLFAAIYTLNSVGITSVVDARSYWQRGHDDVWQKLLQQEPELFTIRAILDLWAAPEETDDAAQIQSIKNKYKNEADSLLRVSGVKVGKTISTTL